MNLSKLIVPTGKKLSGNYFALLLIVAIMSLGQQSNAQVTITTTGNYTQNFDVLAASTPITKHLNSQF